ncbi:hypothetical protein QQP08_009430 [Theobroma cacao]|nr:hypothetical protein QQP08_009430 [Theobroma cacao]
MAAHFFHCNLVHPIVAGQLKLHSVNKDMRFLQIGLLCMALYTVPVQLNPVVCFNHLQGQLFLADHVEFQ